MRLDQIESPAILKDLSMDELTDWRSRFVRSWSPRWRSGADILRPTWAWWS